MAEHRKQIRGIILLCLSLILSALSPDTRAQDSLLTAPADTSYFRSGADDWNLVESVILGEPGNVLLLLKRGANPDARAEGGMTALMFAAEAGDTLIMKILILNGADIELGPVEDTSPLMVAVLKKQFQSAHLLLKRGANPDARDEYGGTCLIYAAATNQYAMADLLLFYGADPSLKNREGNDALLTAVQASFLECTDVLLQNGILPDSSMNAKKETPLMLAARKVDTAMVNLLLDRQASTEQTDKRNFTALAYAITAGSLETVKLLAADGAYLHHSVSPTRNLYDLAVMEHQREIAKWMKDSGAAPTPRPDFSEVHIVWGNSFNSSEHMMQGRIRWSDQKFGFFLESGFDIRPVSQVVQVALSNNLLHQYRENRWALVLGAGKDFIANVDLDEFEIGAYFAIHTMLSGASYRGISEHPPMKFKTIPSAGFLLQGRAAGIRMGLEYYKFGTLQEKPWKGNITLYLKIPYKYGIKRTR